MKVKLIKGPDLKFAEAKAYAYLVQLFIKEELRKNSKL